MHTYKLKWGEIQANDYTRLFTLLVFPDINCCNSFILSLISTDILLKKETHA